ncbi:hypothetical protein DFP73DRAFT_565562 [Morchella snyderi]|nr:hypothetical protein DFP73DRAFT_565562 [Morchella snyderi]
MSANFRYLLVFFCVLLTVGADTFPAFKVEPRPTSAEATLELAKKHFGDDNWTVIMHNGRYIALACDGRKRVEQDTISGGIIGTDNCDSPDPAHGPPEDLPTEEDAKKMAEGLLKEFLPTEGGAVVIECPGTTNTFLAHEYEFNGDYIHDEWKTDISVDCIVSIRVGDELYPLTGGGGKFRVTYGSCGKLIGFSALWREIVGQEMQEIISMEEAQAEFNQTLGPFAGLATVTTYLGYNSAPFGVCQKLMPPVWVHKAVVVANGQKVPLRPQNSRRMTVSGSGSGRRDLGTESLPRARDARWPAPRSLDDEDQCKLEVGIEYLGEPYGLGLASENAAGFRSAVMHTAPIGNVSYEKSNDLVWASDWTTDDERYADDVDMVWYTGHANMNGWMVTVPGTGAPAVVEYTSFNERPEDEGDLLGHKDLEWLAIAACGPHQHETFDSSAGNVFDRWRGIFHGLHIMFAYGTESSDSTDEGAKFMRYAQEGYSLIDAWFRAAKEVQPAGVIVTAMWADDARDDHLPGYGSVSNNSYSASSQDRWFMWSTC